MLPAKYANQWGDPKDLKLPNTVIVLQVSTLWWQREDPREDRSYRKPDLSASLTFANYANDIDPVMHEVEQVTDSNSAHLVTH